MSDAMVSIAIDSSWIKWLQMPRLLLLGGGTAIAGIAPLSLINDASSGWLLAMNVAFAVIALAAIFVHFRLSFAVLSALRRKTRPDAQGP